MGHGDAEGSDRQVAGRRPPGPDPVLLEPLPVGHHGFGFAGHRVHLDPPGQPDVALLPKEREQVVEPGLEVLAARHRPVFVEVDGQQVSGMDVDGSVENAGLGADGQGQDRQLLEPMDVDHHVGPGEQRRLSSRRTTASGSSVARRTKCTALCRRLPRRSTGAWGQSASNTCSR